MLVGNGTSKDGFRSPGPLLQETLLGDLEAKKSISWGSEDHGYHGLPSYPVFFLGSHYGALHRIYR